MRQYLAAIAGLFTAISFASAQAPRFTPAGNYANTPVSANSAFTPAGNYANAQAQVQLTGGYGDPVVANGPGCSACGPTLNNSKHHGIGAGCSMPIGCSNFAAERTFLFGSCRQFFNPGNDCGSHSNRFGGCNGTGYPGIGGCNSCGGGGNEKHPCQGVTSYLNR